MSNPVQDLACQTIKVLEENGWTQGAFSQYSETNPGEIKFCLVGAMRYAVNQLTKDVYWMDAAYRELFDTMSEDLGITLVHWNDYAAESKEGVINFVRRYCG